MYNGIGITSVRGTGTSGYVQTNKFNLRGPPPTKRDSKSDNGPRRREPNAAILEHNKKRDIEVKIEMMRDELEEQGLSEEEIESRLKEYRAELVAEAAMARQPKAPPTQQETHQIAARKREHMEKLRSAFGFREDIKEGEAFNRELQEEKKRKRIAEREERERKQSERERQERKRKLREEEERRREEKYKRERGEELREEGELLDDHKNHERKIQRDRSCSSPSPPRRRDYRLRHESDDGKEKRRRESRRSPSSPSSDDISSTSTSGSSSSYESDSETTSSDSEPRGRRRRR